MPGARILDAPRYAWRGLSLDLARAFFTLDEVRRVVDLLALDKLNVLHLHLTDDQSWRLYSPMTVAESFDREPADALGPVEPGRSRGSRRRSGRDDLRPRAPGVARPAVGAGRPRLVPQLRR